MIKGFEKRYEKLLEEAKKGTLLMLPSVENKGGYLCQNHPVMTVKKEIQCADNAFIEKYCL